MKKLEVLDPPMCCSTGVCGPSVDPALASFAADLHFVDSFVLKAVLKERGNDCLPLILLDGAIVSEVRYPNRKELARLAGAPFDGAGRQPAGKTLPVIKSGCC